MIYREIASFDTIAKNINDKKISFITCNFTLLISLEKHFTLVFISAVSDLCPFWEEVKLTNKGNDNMHNMKKVKQMDSLVRLN